jgi:hypothetical protein
LPFGVVEPLGRGDTGDRASIPAASSQLPPESRTSSRGSGSSSRRAARATAGHLLIDGLAGVALIGIAFVIRDFLRSPDDRMATVGFASTLAAAATSLVQFVRVGVFTVQLSRASSDEAPQVVPAVGQKV